MIKVTVRFDATAYGGWLTYHIYVTLKGDEGVLRLHMKDGEALAWLVNTFANSVKVQSFGYEAQISNSVALAIQYLARVPVSKLEEISKIVKTGTTEIHKFLVKLGFREYAKPDPLKRFPKSVDRDGYTINLENFPKITLFLKDSLANVTFKYDKVNLLFLKHVLSGKSSEEKTTMLKGISLLAERSQTKYMNILSSNALTLETLAKALYRSAISSKNKPLWQEIIKWLEHNGFKNYAGEILIKKTLC